MNFWLFWATVQVYLIGECHLGLGLAGLLNSVRASFFICLFISFFHKEHSISPSPSAETGAVHVYAWLARAPQHALAFAPAKKGNKSFRFY